MEGARLMFVEVTAAVDSHRTNYDYPTVRVVWNGKEHNIRFRQDGSFDWCPTDSEALDITESLAKISPTFREQLLSLAVAIPIPERPSNARSKRVFSGKLEEMLV